MLVTKTIILAATVLATRCDVHLTENRDIDFPVGKKITSHGKSLFLRVLKASVSGK